MNPWAIAAVVGLFGVLALGSSASASSTSSAGAGLIDLIEGGARLMQSFGPTRERPHYGVDLAAPTGRAVYAAASGTVAGAWPDGDLYNTGNTVSLRHDGDQIATVYMHLNDLAVRTGQRVVRGQLLGHVGHTDSTDEGFPAANSHLHFEVLALRSARDAAHFNGTTIPPRLDPAAWAPTAGIRLTRPTRA